MLNEIKNINNIIRIEAMSNLSGNINDCKSNAFAMVLTSLLSAMSKQRQINTRVNEKIQFNNELNNIINMKNINDRVLNKDQEIESVINKYSDKYGIDANLIKSVIKVESNYNANVVSEAGAKGLMQIMPSNYQHLGIENPFNVDENVKGGVKLIKEYLDRYDGNVEMALMAYNGGPTRMANRGVNSINDIYKMPKETQNYVTKVMNYYKGL